jgi:CMP-N,N'-diacetyllegionaminic acid synthase
MSVTEAVHHPHLTCRIREDGTIEDFIPCNIAYRRRQDLPAVYAANGALYLTQRVTLLETHTLTPAGTYAYPMPLSRSLDIDTAWDLHLAELILRNPFEKESTASARP